MSPPYPSTTGAPQAGQLEPASGFPTSGGKVRLPLQVTSRSIRRLCRLVVLAASVFSRIGGLNRRPEKKQEVGELGDLCRCRPISARQHVALATLDQRPALKLFATVDVLKDRPRH